MSPYLVTARLADVESLRRLGQVARGPASRAYFSAGYDSSPAVVEAAHFTHEGVHTLPFGGKQFE